MATDPQQQRIMGYFIEEAKEHLETLRQNLENLATAVKEEGTIDEMFRAAHSIKGGAAMLSVESVRFIAYHLEHYLGMIRDNRSLQVDQRLVDLFMEGYAYLPQLVNQLERNYSISGDMSEAAIHAAQGTMDRLGEHLQHLLTEVSALEDTGDRQVEEASNLAEEFSRVVERIVAQIDQHLTGMRTDEATEQLGQLCAELHQWGERLGSEQWLSLVSMIREILSNPFNSFESLQGVVGQELQRACELVISQRDNEICASAQLQELITPAGEDETYEEDEQTSHIFSTLPVEDMAEVGEDWHATTLQPTDAPRVGPKEIQTLAQLFDQDGVDMESAWQDMEANDTHIFMGLPTSADEDISEFLVGEQTSHAEDEVPQAVPDLDDFLDDITIGMGEEEAELNPSLESVPEDLSAVEQLSGFLNNPQEDEEGVTYMQIDDNDVPSNVPSPAQFMDFSGEDFAENWEESLDNSLSELEVAVSQPTTMQSSGELAENDYSEDIDDIVDNPFTDLGDLHSETGDSMFAESDNLDQMLGLDQGQNVLELFAAEPEAKDTENPFAGITDAGNYSDSLDFSPNLDDLFTPQDGSSVPPVSHEEVNLCDDLSFAPPGDHPLDDLLSDTSDLFGDLDRSQDQPVGNLLEAGGGRINEEEETGDDMDFLNALMGDTASAPPVNNSELEELSHFFDFGEDTPELGEMPEMAVSEPALTDAADFADLEALIGSEDDFAHLEALLEEPSGNGGMDFPDLEALLADTPAVIMEAPVPAKVESAETTQPDRFADLENMLKNKSTTEVKAEVKTTPVMPARSTTRAVVNNVRVDVKYLDSLNNLVGELVVNRNLLSQDQERLQNFLTTLLGRVQQLGDLSQRMRDQYDRSLLESSLMVGRTRNQMFAHMAHDQQSIHDALPSVTAEFDAIEFDRYNAFHILSQEIIELIVKIKESASDIEFVVTETEQVTRELGRIANQLQDDLKQSRMVPFANLADRLPRGIRDRAVKTGKQAELKVIGGDTLIDKAILEQLTDPMTHLVNNAVDHGLETPEERRRAGKPEYGTIEVKAYHQGNQTLITVRDDGGGINPEKVKEKAVKKGLKTSAEVQRMTDNEAYELLFMAGFSTKDQADQFAGRGVGLDVVKSTLDNIKGSIYIDSQIGKGTQFTIRLPLTLSISKAIFCVIDGIKVAIPIDGFEDMVEVPRSQVLVNNIGQDCIPWQDMILPFRPLSSLLTFNRRLGRVYARQETDEITVIVVRNSENNYLGLQVDQFLGEYEIVVKQLEGVIPKPPGIAGATVLGDGRVISIVNVLELFDIAEGRMKISTSISEPIDHLEEQTSQPIVLVVDDSIVVREMLSATFTKAGYFVESARDGQDAWEKLRGGMPCDLIFCDIEMPKMDGLQLLAKLQKDEHLSKIPMAMLTSRSADKHRQTAIQSGAKAYFTKPYLEEELLKASQRLLKGEVLV